MAFSRQVIAIELGRRRLRAMLATRHRSSVTVDGLLTARVPAEVNIDDAQALGAWVGRCLADARFPNAAVTVALSREHVVVKRVTLPTTDDEDLPGMTQLAVQRDLPFAAGSAVIDFVAVRRDATSTTVMAAAVEDRRLAFGRQVAAAAGLRVQRVSLRCMGTAALLGSESPTAAAADSSSTAGVSEGILAVEVTSEGVEYTVVTGGTMRFSRAAEIAEVDDPAALAEGVVTETRRTWLSYRAAEDAEAVKRLIVLGERSVRDRVADAVGDIVQVPAELLSEHRLVRTGGRDLSGYWSLAGLVLGQVIGAPGLDFNRPRKSPDRPAQRRQLVLAGIGLAVVGAGAAWTVGNHQYRAASELAVDLERKAVAAQAEYNRFRRDQDKLRHLTHWEDIRVDWLAHALRLEQAAPPPPQIVFDSWIGSLNTLGVRWDKATDKWSWPMEVKINIEGEARNRDAAVAFRNALVADESYVTASVGSDSTGGRRLPQSFAYQLQTTLPTPGARTGTLPAASGKPASGGAAP